MRLLILNGAAVLTLLTVSVSIKAQTVIQPGQLASTSEASVAVSSPDNTSGNSPASTPKVEISNVQPANDNTGRRLWLGSIFAVATASGADAATSWGKYEGNSFLASSDGTFGAKALGIKVALAGALMVPEVILLRRHHDLYRKFAFVNFADAAVFTGLSFHNLTVSAPKN